MRCFLFFLLPLVGADWLEGAAAAETNALAPAVAAAAPASSATAAPLTLAEAVRLTLAHNFTIRAAEFAPRIAAARSLEAAGAFDPTLRGRYEYSDDGSIAPSDPFGGTRPPASIVKTDSYEISLGGLTPLGTSYALVGNTVNQRGTYNAFADQYYTFGGVRVTQPLLRGFGFAANLAGVRVARAQRAIAGEDLRLAVTQSVTRTIEAYHGLHLAQRGYEVSVRSHALAGELLRENRRRGEVGNMAPADVLIAEARVARLEGGVIAAERDLREAQNYLRMLISDRAAAELDTPLAIDAPTPPSPFAPDRAADLARAYTLRPEFRQAEQNVKLTGDVRRARRSEVLPQIDLVGSYGYNGAGNDFTQSYRDARSGDTVSWSAGAVVNVPIAFRAGRGRARAARLENERAQVELQELAQQIAVEVTNAAGQIDATRARVEAAGRARRLAESSLTAEQKRLQVGQSTTFTVLQFQDLLSSAQIAEDRALADHHIAVARYQRAIGTTLEEHAITLDEPAR